MLLLNFMLFSYYKHMFILYIIFICYSHILFPYVKSIFFKCVIYKCYSHMVFSYAISMLFACYSRILFPFIFSYIIPIFYFYSLTPYVIFRWYFQTVIIYKDVILLSFAICICYSPMLFPCLFHMLFLYIFIPYIVQR